MLGPKKSLFWLLVAMLAASLLWILDVEVTYERNVRHIPADFRIRQHSPTLLWKV